MEIKINKQDLRENLHNAVLLGCLATGILFSIGSPLMYDNLILIYGQFLFILILIGLFIFKFIELRKWFKNETKRI